jgi:hypothetical protein
MTVAQLLSVAARRALTRFLVAPIVCLAGAPQSSFAQEVAAVRVSAAVLMRSKQPFDALDRADLLFERRDTTTASARQHALEQLAANLPAAVPSRRSTHVWIGIAVGGLAGGALGFHVGDVHSRRCTGEACEGGPNLEPIADMVVWGVVGGAVGGALGALWSFLP